MPLVKVVVVALLHAAVGVGDGGCIAAGCAVGASERACVAACCLVVPGEGAVRWVRLREAALLNPARWMQTLMAALMAALLMTLPVLVVLMLAVVLLVLLAWEQPRAQPWALQQGQPKGRQ